MTASSRLPSGRGLDTDHPGNLRMEDEAIAGLRAEDRAQAELESFGLSQGAALALTGRELIDRYDKAESDWNRMEREEKGAPHPNEWAA